MAGRPITSRRSRDFAGSVDRAHLLAAPSVSRLLARKSVDSEANGEPGALSHRDGCERVARRSPEAGKYRVASKAGRATTSPAKFESASRPPRCSDSLCAASEALVAREPAA